MNARIIFKLQFFGVICLMLSGCADARVAQTPTITSPANPASTQLPAQSPGLPSESPDPADQPGASQTLPAPLPFPKEAPVVEIAIEGPLAESKSEVSGLTWWGDRLLILPQYPENYLSESGLPSLFAIPKTEIINYLENPSPAAIEPIQIAILNSIEPSQVPGYEGFEAIAMDGDKVYLTIEANHRGVMQGYLITGNLHPGGDAIDLDPASLTEIPTPVQIFNAAYETIIARDGSVLALFEAHGEDLNPVPEAMLLEAGTGGFSKIPLGNIEYRITDATGIDNNGRFWVLNIFMPIEFWYYTRSDPIIEHYGLGSSHQANNHVERLLELKYNQGEISLSGTAPLYLDLDDFGEPRNWEGLVRLDELGFLAITDTYPGTIFAYIPYP
jgi:hypothetical protein